MLRPILTLTAAAGLAFAPPTFAASPWSAPQDLSTARTFVDAPALLVSGRGATLASWRWQDGIGESGRTQGTGGAARRSGADTFAPERAISAGRTPAQRPSVVVGPVPYASTRTLAATLRPEDARGERSRLSVVFGDDAGRFGGARSLTVGNGISSPALAANTSGDAAVAWFVNRGVAGDRVFVALRRHGGAFGGPVLLETGRVRSVSVAVSPHGDVLVAWDARGTIRTRTRRAGGRHFGATQTIASEPAFSATLRTALTARGRAYVGWTAQRLSEGGDRGAFTAQVAVRPVGVPRFRAAQLLEQQSRGAVQAGLDLAVDGEDATFVWAGLYAGRERIRAVQTNASALFGRLQDVSPEGAGAVDPTLAIDAGRRLIAWVRGTVPGEDGEGAIVAALAPAGGPFGAAELVTSGPQARVPDAAFVPAGAPTIVWSNRPGGHLGVPPAQIRTYAQAATRTG